MPGTSAPAFPFSAIVGSELLKYALLLNLVDARVGGVLIRGDRGTAKSTIVRALRSLLAPIRTREGCAVQCDPDAGVCTVCGDAGSIVQRAPHVVDLPLGATEDRVAGSLDLARALSSGERRFEPGLLGAAHRGVLYVDEVNLLPDHLVDLLLDVAASGVNVVERDGASAAHPARFILVGTMNPEEGDLRPQLLDRFGLVLDVRTPVDPLVRAEVVRRRIAFDTDPLAFAARFADADAALRARIDAARALLPKVVVPAAVLDLAVELCVEAGAHGLRADITLYRAAAAHAALAGRVEVTLDDVLDVAPLVLGHRESPPPPDGSTLPPLSDRLKARRQAGDDATPEASDVDDPVNAHTQPRDEAVEDGSPDRRTVRGLADRVPLSLPDARSRMRGAHARRGAATGPRGRVAGARAWDRASTDVAVIPTLVAAARRGEAVQVSDVRAHRRIAQSERLVLLLVDGSASMGARDRMAVTKAGLRAILDEVYRRRDRIAVQVFRQGATQLVLRPGRSIRAAHAAIEVLPTGGGTPLDGALRAAAALLRDEERRHPTRERLLVVVTDGRSRGAVQAAAGEAAAAATASMVVDAEDGRVRLGRARTLATWLSGEYRVLPSPLARVAG